MTIRTKFANEKSMYNIVNGEPNYRGKILLLMYVCACVSVGKCVGRF